MMYALEEIPDPSDLNWKLMCERLRKQNELLQNLVEEGDQLIAEKSSENKALKDQLRQKQLTIAADLTDELDELQRVTAEQELTISMQRKKIRQLDKENKDLQLKNETVTSEMSYLLPEKAKDKAKIANLSTSLKTLQQEMEEAHLCLDQMECALLPYVGVAYEQLESSLAEHYAIIQDQRNTIKELKSQLEETVVFGGQGSGAPPTPQAICFADELLMWLRSGKGVANKQLESSLAEHSAIIQDQRNTIKELKSQLEEIVVWWPPAKALMRCVLAGGAFTLGIALAFGLFFLFLLGLVTSGGLRRNRGPVPF